MKFLFISAVLLYLTITGSCTYLPYGYQPNSANGRAVGGQAPSANGQAVSNGLGPAINVNPVNNAVSRSNSVPSNYQQASLPGGSSFGCGYGIFC